MVAMFPTDRLPEKIRTGDTARVGAVVEPGFKVGDRVQVANIHPVTYTRLPRYARGKTGVIERDHGVFLFSDAHGEMLEDKPQHVYSVVFDAVHLWGTDASPNDKLYLDLFEDYLTAAG